MKKAFTLVELLVVIGIIAILMAVLMVAFRNAPEKALMQNCHELVKQTEVALTQGYDDHGAWPQVLRANSGKAKGLDETAAYPLRDKMSLSADTGTKRLKGNDRFGIVTTWAARVIKDQGSSCNENTVVSSVGGTIADHRLRYALSLDGHGTVKDVNVAGTVEGVRDGQTKDVRAMVAVWCRGPKGQFLSSWTEGQTEKVK